MFGVRRSDSQWMALAIQADGVTTSWVWSVFAAFPFPSADLAESNRQNLLDLPAGVSTSVVTQPDHNPPSLRASAAEGMVPH